MALSVLLAALQRMRPRGPLPAFQHCPACPVRLDPPGRDSCGSCRAVFEVAFRR